MNAKEKGEFEVIKFKVERIESDVTEIKETLKDHVIWEKDKYDKLDEKYVHREEWEDFKTGVRKVENKIWEVTKMALPWIFALLILGITKSIGL